MTLESKVKDVLNQTVWLEVLTTPTFEQRHEISNNVVCATSKGSLASHLNILCLLSY